MTLFDFIKDSIISDNPEKDIPTHISEVAVMYHLFNGQSDIDIYASVSNGAIGFSILSEKEDDAHELKQRLNGSHYTTYGSTFDIKARCRKNTVYVNLVKRQGEGS